MSKEVWITANEAAEILSRNSGRTITSDYVRVLAKNGKLRARVQSARVKLYNKADVEEYQVKQYRWNYRKVEGE